MTKVNEVTEKAISQSGGRKILIMIFAIPVMVILLSTALYYMVETEVVELGTVNNGTLLIPPLPMNELAVSNKDGLPLGYSESDPQWSFVIFGGKHCDGACERMLYLSRQAHYALEKRFHRIRRLYVSVDGDISSELQQSLDKEYKDVIITSLDKQALLSMFAASGVDPLLDNSFFVLDHRGWLMMYYTADDQQQQTLNVLGKAVIRDMKRLLK